MHRSAASTNPTLAGKKRRIAIVSVAVAAGLLAMKAGVGWWTNSLALLSMAADATLDVLASGITLWAVHLSAKPADREHTYGHGKFENISALFETVLLLGICGWIVYEAVARLAGLAGHGGPEVRPNFWAFAVVVVSIGFDISRSTALRRAARKYNSQALEADALHFSTDVWSSLVVLLGLTGVAVAERWGVAWLRPADSLAALVVAAIVTVMSVRLGRKALADLLDAVPPELVQRVTDAARETPGVADVKQVRVRRSGAELFADVTVAVRRQAGLEDAHAVADRAERAVAEVITPSEGADAGPDVDVVIHVEPIAPGDEDITTTIRVLARRQGMGAHAIRIYHDRPSLSDTGTSADGDPQRVSLGIELHLEVPESLDLHQAHDRATEFERQLRADVPGVERIVTHLEPAGDVAATCQAEPAGQLEVYRLLSEFADQHPTPIRPHDVRVHDRGDHYDISFHCGLAPGTNITDAHRRTEQIEEFLRQRLPGLGRVVIHVEPEKGL
jgi:cation diffusion facilitator family transporter